MWMKGRPDRSGGCTQSLSRECEVAITSALPAGAEGSCRPWFVGLNKTSFKRLQCREPLVSPRNVVHGTKPGITNGGAEGDIVRRIQQGGARGVRETGTSPTGGVGSTRHGYSNVVPRESDLQSATGCVMTTFGGKVVAAGRPNPLLIAVVCSRRYLSTAPAGRRRRAPIGLYSYPATANFSVS